MTQQNAAGRDIYATAQGIDAAKARIQQRHLRNTRTEHRNLRAVSSVDGPARRLASGRARLLTRAQLREWSARDERSLLCDRQLPRIVAAARRASSERPVQDP